MEPDTINTLRTRLRELGSAVVAFSAGVDSTLVARLAHDALGARATALTVVSPSLPAAELAEARELARDIGIAHVTLDGSETSDPRYLENTPLRCYWCKHEAYGLLAAWAQAHGFLAVLDGTNLDDTGDDRPGRRAAAELGVRSPLLEAGLTKADVRALARELGLPNWDKPAAACLASRIPHGTPITLQALSQVERAEVLLRSFGAGQVRVRHEGRQARIEVADGGFAIVVQHREEIAQALASLGFARVVLDLAGYRQGGANDVTGVKA